MMLIEPVYRDPWSSWFYSNMVPIESVFCLVNMMSYLILSGNDSSAVSPVFIVWSSISNTLALSVFAVNKTTGQGQCIYLAVVASNIGKLQYTYT